MQAEDSCSRQRDSGGGMKAEDLRPLNLDSQLKSCRRAHLGERSCSACNFHTDVLRFRLATCGVLVGSTTVDVVSYEEGSECRLL